jgi:uncharacterized protein YwgA
MGRTRLQKTVKLLQRLGMPTDYRYTIFFYGPYSEGVFGDIGLLAQLGLVVEQEHPGADGKTWFELVASADAELEELGPWRPAIAKMEQADLVVLELAATYDAFREMGSDHAEAVARLKHKKATKWSEERQARAMEVLRELGLPAG